MRFRYLLLSSLLLLFSCEGKKDEPVPVEPTPTDIPVIGITLSASTLSLETGGKATLTATVKPSNATDPAVTWTSSQAGVASVSDGVVTALAAGETDITAKAGDFSASCHVSVTDPFVAVTAVSLDRKSRLLPLGASFSLKATVLPADASDPSVSWSSSDKNIVVVEGGVVKALAEGSARIVAQASGFQAVCWVAVVPEGPSNREIWYESWTGSALKFEESAGIASNSYQDGKGVLTFKGDVTTIPSDLFQGKTALKNVWLPSTVVEIAGQAFNDCSTLLHVYMQEGIKRIGDDAFRECSSLRELSFPSTLETLGSFVIRGDVRILELVIPENVVELGDYALYGGTSLTSLTFLADKPASMGFRALDETGEGPVYIPSSSVEEYKAAVRWKEYSARFNGY